MALKQRKQITGTTEQINQYAGVEGQLVWDKEKKTFVGMSGTAGKNYPLAPQAYVDNEIEKVNAEVAKKQPKGNYATTAQLTEGLAGKEDKGTCLPLTGGTLTGKLALNRGYIESRSGEYGCIELSAGDTWGETSIQGGAGVYLRAKDSKADEAGSWGIVAINPNTKENYDLHGSNSGELTFRGSLIERTIYLSGDDWRGVVIRYESGLMIISGGFGISNHRQTFTLPIPFKDNGYILTASPTWAGTDIPTLGIDDSSATWFDNTKFTIVCSKPVVGVRFIAIGKWK